LLRLTDGKNNAGIILKGNFLSLESEGVFFDFDFGLATDLGETYGCVNSGSCFAMA
jgi:hypothetical protein